MCRQKRPTSAVVGDEVWDAEEDSCSDSDGSDIDSGPELDSDMQTAASPVPAVRRQTAAEELPHVPQSKVAALQPAPTVARTPIGSPAGRAPAQSVQRPAATAAPAESGLMGLVAHLRGDNARLREALQQAQRELEILAASQAEAAQDTPASIDFAHLLALVKDFGDDPGGGFYGDDSWDAHQSRGDLEVFAISSPRGSEEADDDEEAQEQELVEERAKNLQTELADARSEVTKLREQLVAKDAELCRLRALETEDCKEV